MHARPFALYPHTVQAPEMAKWCNRSSRAVGVTNRSFTKNDFPKCIILIFKTHFFRGGTQPYPRSYYAASDTFPLKCPDMQNLWRTATSIIGLEQIQVGLFLRTSTHRRISLFIGRILHDRHKRITEITVAFPGRGRGWGWGHS